ncbi:MAG: winged helix-turn-helix domain-containing protein [Candidatus Bathyarchaeota archaeon]|nr:winged helix-turn-helix domain-containing protein [Candidatus Bathyarchaeota archaeon]MDH5745450.1 winged helix-turn-helix domain-containing protein [Candidatus Bathyarchaeota archaeon]
MVNREDEERANKLADTHLKQPFNNEASLTSSMQIENILGSRIRVKILKILAQVGELNVSEIARRLGVNYTTTSKHLKILEDEHILQHKVYGRIRLYRFNEHSPKAKAIQELMETWEHANKQ